MVFTWKNRAWWPLARGRKSQDLFQNSFEKGQF